MKTRNIHIRNISDADAFNVEIYNFNGAHQFVDSTNASVEIGRRGLFRFESGSFYPEVTERDADTLEAVLAVGNDGSNGRDVLHKIVSRSFIDAYKSGRSISQGKTSNTDTGFASSRFRKKATRCAGYIHIKVELNY